MKLVTPEEMREIDRLTIEKYNIPGLRLMENAGLSVALLILKRDIDLSNIFVICGKGNNGGDGLVLARVLKIRGYNPKVILIAKKDELTGDAKVNLDTFLDLEGTEVHEITEFGKMRELENPSLIIDALFGTGLKEEVRGIYEDVISWINKKNAYTVSLDIPSGLNGETGIILGSSVKADLTVTFGLPKIGCYIQNGPLYSGEIVITDIGIPPLALDEFDIRTHVITHTDIQKIFKIRAHDSHKGNFGHVAVVAGSKGKAGAAKLAARASLISGCGLVTLYVPQVIERTIEDFCLEEMMCSLPSDDEALTNEGFNDVTTLFNKQDTILIGPGLGTKKDIEHIVKECIRKVSQPLVIDADGLNVLGNNPSCLKEKKGVVILTPHPGEMARLTGKTISEIQDDRFGSARNFAGEFSVYVVLKGYRTIIATPDGHIFMNLTGNPGMATAGTGDVLGGVITSYITQGYDITYALILAVYFHGKAGDFGAHKKSYAGLRARDIIKEIPYVIKSYEKSS